MSTHTTPGAKPTPTTASQATPNASSQTKPETDKLADQAKTVADDTVDSISTEAKSKADEIKSSVADEVSGISSALRTAADEMRRGSPQERTFSQIADGLADASEAMRDKDLGTMVRDVSQFARRNPLAFLGGAVLIGFVATRFAKASDETSLKGDMS